MKFMEAHPVAVHIAERRAHGDDLTRPNCKQTAAIVQQQSIRLCGEAPALKNSLKSKEQK